MLRIYIGNFIFFGWVFLLSQLAVTCALSPAPRQGSFRMSSVDPSSMMALADQRAGAQSMIPGTTPTILCCMCGTPMVWNQASMCANCIRTRVDITEGIPKSVPMQHCRACGRFLNPPKQWVACQPESKELLAICLKRIKGLNKVKLIDASFIWTEAHSKRLKVRQYYGCRMKFLVT